MRILIADDDPIALLLLRNAIDKWDGYETVSVRDGAAAWEVLQGDDPPPIAIVDWMMPGIDGIDICRKSRSMPQLESTYFILLTGKEGMEARLTGLQAGANDYLTKPFDPAELEARIRVASQVVHLQLQLRARVQELEDTLAHVKQLETLLPICMYCKKIRDEQNSWHQMESYISAHSNAEFSHGICADCYESICEPQLKELGESP
jgi:sigma-B regulation protein RsbU (phosphoserine phosphatase)